MIERQINKKNNISDIEQWAINGDKKYSKDEYYCPTRDIFQARLSGFLEELRKKLTDDNRAFLLTAIVGEIGNNSFDHNLGKWLDVPGVCFDWDPDNYLIILADRGQGVLTTIKKVRPTTNTNQKALQTAFTETLSGRSPERRGNGLKFVRQVAQANSIEISFHSGDALCFINNNEFTIKLTTKKVPGTLAIIKF